MSELLKLGLIGDLHGSWDDWDTRFFSASDYALLLFMGDLGRSSGDSGVRVARSVGRINKAALVMPGNNDVHDAARIAAELGHQRGLWALRKVGAALGSMPAPASAGGVHLCGYSVHSYAFGTRAIDVLAARPYAMGGGELSFPERLRSHFEIDSMEASRRKLRELVDQTHGDELIVLAHNGPSGLGALATDLWGADFRAEAGDWGDPDLADCIAYAAQRGKRVLAVLAGHMHSPTRARVPRTWQRKVGGTLYINAARVPRIWEDEDGRYRHHIALEIGNDGASAREVIVREGG